MTTAEEWLDPGTLYKDGFQGKLSTALRLYPVVQRHVREWVAWIAPRRAIEIGPGDRPVIADIPKPIFLEMSPYFLRGLRGLLVRGDVRRCPFRPGMVDLVVVADVFSHFSPDDRLRALPNIIGLAPRVLIFNNENGTPEHVSSRVPRNTFVGPLEAAGHHVHVKEYNVTTHQSGIAMSMQIIYAVAKGTSPRVEV